MFVYVVCDVFTDHPLEGNQLAVFTAAEPIPERWLQPIAREMNFSETVFVYPGGAQSTARIRIFTPATELPFAGHLILGTAVLLAEERGVREVGLETGRGVVPVTVERNSQAAFGWMSQPLPTVKPVSETRALFHAIGVDRSLLPVELYDNGVDHLYVALENEAAVASLRPDMGALARIVPRTGVNCFAGSGKRWKTRMFGPGLGVAEDPGTGSAAGPLAVHLARHGRIAFGDEIVIAQGAEVGRPCTLHARAEGSADRLERVAVGGSAVVVARGELISLPA